MSPRFYLVRHAEAAAKGYLGHTDPPLSERGRAQAGELARAFSGFDGKVWSSDLRRCVETAALVFPGRELRLSSELREVFFGEWDGLTAEEIDSHDRDRFRAWLSDPLGNRPPGGEGLLEMTERVVRFVDSLDAGRDHVLVTHGGPARALLCETLGLGVEGFWRVEIEHARVAVVSRGEKKALLGLNVREFSWEGSR